MTKPLYQRVIVKVSGESLMGPDAFGIHQPTLEQVAADLVATQAVQELPRSPVPNIDRVAHCGRGDVRATRAESDAADTPSAADAAGGELPEDHPPALGRRAPSRPSATSPSA